MPPPLSPVLRFLGAGVFGIACGGALVGASVVLRFSTDLAIPLIPLFVGVAVGYSVRYASNDRRTRVYRVLAVVLTYAISCATWIPDVIDHLEEVAANSRSEGAVNEGAVVSIASEEPSESAPRTALDPAPAEEDDLVDLQGKAWGAYLVFGMSLLWPYRSEGVLDALLVVFAMILAWTLNSSPVSQRRRSREKGVAERDRAEPKDGGSSAESEN